MVVKPIRNYSQHWTWGQGNSLASWNTWQADNPNFPHGWLESIGLNHTGLIWNRAKYGFLGYRTPENGRNCLWTGSHVDFMKWKHFPRYWPFVWGIHRYPHKGQWRGALKFSLICTRINGWVNNCEAGDLGRYRAHDDVTVMIELNHTGLIWNRTSMGSLVIAHRKTVVTSFEQVLLGSW